MFYPFIIYIYIYIYRRRQSLALVVAVFKDLAVGRDKQVKVA
jgi:hypothetical protein